MRMRDYFMHFSDKYSVLTLSHVTVPNYLNLLTDKDKVYAYTSFLLLKDMRMMI